MSGQKHRDPELQGDYDTAVAKKSENDEAEVAFRPADNVYCSAQYNFRIHQTYACLTAQEYENIVGLPPIDPILGQKGNSIQVAWHGPHKAKTTFWLLGLDGLDYMTAMAVRKVDIEFVEGVQYDEVYLQSSDQLIQSQGARVFPHIVKKKEAQYGEHFDFEKLDSQTKAPWLSFKQAMARLEKAREVQAASDEAAQTLAAKMQSHADHDDFDNLLEEEDDMATAQMHEVHRRKKGPMGLDGGSLGPSQAAPKPGGKAKAKKKADQKLAVGDVESTTASSGNAGPAVDLEKAASSMSGKKASTQSQSLDSEMALVASKQAGQSTKCLEQFDTSTFVLQLLSRTSLSSKLRGVSCMQSGVGMISIGTERVESSH